MRIELGLNIEVGLDLALHFFDGGLLLLDSALQEANMIAISDGVFVRLFAAVKTVCLVGFLPGAHRNVKSSR